MASSGLCAHQVGGMQPAESPTQAGEGGGGGAQLTIAISRFLRDLHCHGAASEAVHPVGVLHAVSSLSSQYSRRTQQDSHEVLRQLLEGLRTEMAAATAAPAASDAVAAASSSVAAGAAAPSPAATPAEAPTLVDATFGGALRSTVVCLTCGAVSTSHEPFLDMSLPIPRIARKGSVGSPTTEAAMHAEIAVVAGSRVAAADVLAKLPSELTATHERMRLAACLQAFGAPEVLHGENAYTCTWCRDKAKAEAENVGGGDAPPMGGQPALKWVQIARVPRVLTLHLKRFRSTGRRVHKIDEHVPFPALVDLSAFACAEPSGEPIKHFSQLGAASRPPSPVRMRLYAVVEHQGNFTGGQ